MAQIKKKFLASNAVDGTKVQYSNNESFRAKSSSGNDVELFKLDGSNLFQFLQLPRVGSDPSNGNDVSRKSYVDAQILAEAAARVQADAAEQAAREAAVAAEESRALAAEAVLQAAIDSEEADRIAAVSAEQSARETADSNLQSAIDDEETRALAAEAVLQAAIDALDTGNAQALADEVAARIAGDADLQSQVNTEKGRIDAILLASDADKDSFAEIVSLINSVDTTNDNAFASYVLSNNAALAQEVSDREDGDTTLQNNINSEAAARQSADETLQDNIDAEEDRAMAAEGALSGRLDIIEGADSVEGSVAKAEKDAKDFAQGLVDAEQSARESADSDLQDAIDAEVAARQAAVTGEENARMVADSALQSELDATQGGAGLGTDGSYSAPVGSSHLGSAVSLKDADSKLDAAIVAETNARTTAVSNLEQSIADLDAAMSQGFDDAQAYTDQKISDLVDGAPALLDTLNELAAAIGDDENFASNILTAVSNEASARQAADTAEANARSSADSALQSDIDQEILDRQSAVSAEQTARQAAITAESDTRTAELPRFAKVRYTLTSTDVSNGYVDLDHSAIDSSVHVFIDRLACHSEDDYTLSVVDGVTRVTFTSSFKNSEEGPAAGDLFRCGYCYKNEDQSSGSGGGGGGGGGGGFVVTVNGVSPMGLTQVSWTTYTTVTLQFEMMPGMWIMGNQIVGYSSYDFSLSPGTNYRLLAEDGTTSNTFSKPA